MKMRYGSDAVRRGAVKTQKAKLSYFYLYEFIGIKLEKKIRNNFLSLRIIGNWPTV